MTIPMTASRAQLERLLAVGWKEWEEAQDALLPYITRLLHGRLVTGEDGKKYMKGGYTQYGAHSECELGGDALLHYMDLIVGSLYSGEYEWDPEKTLIEQLIFIAKPVIANATEDYKNRKKQEKKLGVNSNPVSLDADWLGKEDDYTGEVTTAENELIMSLNLNGTDERHQMWETICEAADGDPELETFVQVTGECKTMKEVRDRLGLKNGDRDRLQKRLKRRVTKIVKHNGEKEDHQRTKR